MICDTENCNNEATHWDQVKNPICQACIDTAMTFDESVDNFTLIGDEPPIEDISDTIQIIKDATAAADGQEKETCPDESTTETEIIEAEHGANLGDASTSSTTSALTIFEETLTEDGLAVIKSQAANLPAIARNETDYDTVYEFSTRLKRLSVAVRKKEKTIQKDLKTDFTTRKLKISKDLDYVTGIITPLIDMTITSRDYMESWIEARKEQKAKMLAETATREQNRIHIFSVYDQAHAENIERDNEIKETARTETERVKKERLQAEEAERVKNDAAKLKAEQAKLAQEEAEAQKYINDQREQIKRERYEFECEKTRLDVDDAWTDWVRREATAIETLAEAESLPTMSVIGNSQDHLDAVETLREFAKDEPAEPVETETFADEIPQEIKDMKFAENYSLSAGLESLKNDDSIIENAVKMNTNGPTYTGKPLSEKDLDTIENQLGPSDRDVIYSTNPTEKEKQLLEQDEIKIRSVIIPVETVIDSLTITQQIGFESITATTATRDLIAEIQAAADRFKAAVSPRTGE